MGKPDNQHLGSPLRDCAPSPQNVDLQRIRRVLARDRLLARAISLVLAFAGIVVLIVFLKYLALFLGVGISIPPNECDLKAGWEWSESCPSCEYTFCGHDSARLCSSRDVCLLELGKAQADARVCNGIRSSTTKYDCIVTVAIQQENPSVCHYLKHKSPGGLYLDKWECVRTVAVNIYDRDLCTEIEDGAVRGPCLNDIAQIEKERTTYQEAALVLANSDLAAAIMECQQFEEPVNRKTCYAAVSDAFSGITLENQFDPPPTLVDLCLGEPNEYEWLACLYGNVFDSLTATDRFDSFREQVISEQYRIDTYCQLFVSEPGNPGNPARGFRGYCGPAIELRDDICRADGN